MKKIFIYSLFVLAFLERTIFDLGPNFELVTLAMVMASFYLDKKLALILTAILMVFSDLLIGNSNIFIFTWSGFLLPILFIGVFKNLKLNKILSGTLAGILSNIFFFLWTNFGVWLLDSWGMYPKTAMGLISSYLNGLPFLKYQLISTILFVPLGFGIYKLIVKLKNYFFTSGYLSGFAK
ncbi:MAG: DUF6580 family putative transport protein [Parachlamydiales bacterium]